MKGNNKIIVYGCIAAVVLFCVCGFLLLRLFSNNRSANGDNSVITNIYSSELLKAVPTDAVFIALTENTKNLSITGKNFAINLNSLWHDPLFNKFPSVLSLHYSSRNEVSSLYVSELSEENRENVLEFINQNGGKRYKDYNGVVIYQTDSPETSYSAFYNSLFLNSKSPYILETSIRHLTNKISILDNKGFKLLAKKYDGLELLYINHIQIGKFFSGCVEYDWLQYSNFFMRLCQWSVCTFDQDADKINIKADLLTGMDEKNYSTIFINQKAVSSDVCRCLPSSTLFFCNSSFSDLPDYNKRLGHFLEANKMDKGYYSKLSSISKDKLEPSAFIDSLGVNEVAAAWCKFGDSFEWINLIKVTERGKLRRLWNKFLDKDTLVAYKYQYKGYLDALFGDMYSHANEDYFVNLGEWIVIGTKQIIESYVSNDANYYSLKDYLVQTPAKGFVESKASTRLYVNLKEAKDSVLVIFKNPLKSNIQELYRQNNFSIVTVDCYPENGDSYIADVNIFSTHLDEMPVPKIKDVPSKAVFTDSTISVPQGPYELEDFVNGGSCYLEQQKNNKLSYINGLKKRVWTIDFNSPIAGYVCQADLYKNGKLQMIFAAEDKVYALDRLGRFVKGYPKQLDKEIELGPVLLDLYNNKEYTFIALAKDNSIMWRDLNSGKPVEGWKDIKSSQFVKTIPEHISINGDLYWIVRNSFTVEFYDSSGKMIEIKSRKRVISPDSKVTYMRGNEVKVKGIDGKEFVVDIISGKTKGL